MLSVSSGRLYAAPAVDTNRSSKASNGWRSGDRSILETRHAPPSSRDDPWAGSSSSGRSSSSAGSGCGSCPEWGIRSANIVMRSSTTRSMKPDGMRLSITAISLPVDLVSLRRVRDDAAVAASLQRRFGHGMARQTAPFVDFAGIEDAAAFGRRFSGKLRANRSRRRRRLQEDGPLRFDHFGPSPEAATLVRMALRFKRDWARHRGILAPLLCDPRFERFFVEAAEVTGRRSGVARFGSAARLRNARHRNIGALQWSSLRPRLGPEPRIFQLRNRGRVGRNDDPECPRAPLHGRRPPGTCRLLQARMGDRIGRRG